MKKILIASPIRGGVSPTYVRSLMNLLFSRLNKIGGGPNAPYEMQWASTSGTTVAMARDELAKVAISGGSEEIVYWDVDINSDNPNTQLAMWARLLSHDVDVVGGQYVGHNFNSKFHGAATDGAELRPDGLLEMGQIPLGFSKIKVSALLKIKAALPWRTYLLKQTDDDAGKPDMFEFFPNGLVGSCTSEGKLLRIVETMRNYKKSATNSGELLDTINVILRDNRYDTSIMLGEDFYFCKLCRDTGVKLYIDNNMIVPHVSNVRLPVPNSVVLDSLCEKWRWSDTIMESEVMHLIETLRSKMASDHL